MRKVTKGQISRIHGLLPKEALHDKQLKQSIIVQFTEDGTKVSTKDLDYVQAESLIYWLINGEHRKYVAYARFEKNNKQHTKMLSIARQLGWVVPHAKYRIVANLELLGEWVATKSKYKQPMKELSQKQMAGMISQFEKLLKNAYTKT